MRDVLVEGPDGVRVHACVEGDGRGVPVVLLHGITRDAGAWAWLVPHLAGDRRVVRVDLRGHGSSDRAPGEYHLDGYVTDAVAVLEAVVAGPAVLVGQSLGGLTGAAVAQQRPDLVAGVLLVDPALQLGEPWPVPGTGPSGPLIDTFHLQREQVPAALATEEEAEVHAARVAVRPSGHGDTVAERYAEGVPLARARAELRCDLSVLDPVIDPPPEHLGPGWDPAAGFEAPGVVLGADRGAPDRVTRRRDAEQLSRVCADLDWVEVEGGGHELQDERDHRATFVAHLDGLLARLDP